MPKIKIPRKSTNIDMTAMCDVAFLLLTFFMLATKFKPEEATKVTIPNSVSSKPIPETNVFIVSIDMDGKVFIQLDNDHNIRSEILELINQERQLGIGKKEMKAFLNFPGFGVPFSKFKSLLQVDLSEVSKVKQEGIPSDSSNNELKTWVKCIMTAYAGKKLSVLIKGDNVTKFKNFKNVINAFKANDMLKFQLATTPEAAPAGTALYETRKKSK